MILPEADLASAIPRRQFASLDAALKYFHHRLLVELMMHPDVLELPPAADALGRCIARNLAEKDTNMSWR